MLRGIFFQQTQKEEENMHNNIYCAGGRMCAKENTPHQSFFVRRWKTDMLRGIFFQQTQKEEENMHNNIYCAGGRMCAKENTPHNNQYY